MNRRLTVFGREPAVLLAGVAAVVSLLGAFVFHLSVDQQGVLNGLAAAVVGLLTAWSLKDGSLMTAIVGLVKAVLYVAVAWHLHVSAENQALILAAVSPLLALIGIRPQVVASVPGPDRVVSPV
jgi:nicotinamide riboside transporter PnuC